ncbi:YiiX/YebB-like N1pC/P60 family cysteine hydrolase [Flavobacterium sp.]|jgi:hypothetical protein|uniref:YiiX/YebB-like N1pC/P60 family cysteine hydrolase n=1 Tax=Flavobacterium sp. TaxID=239 RepID=UPI0037C05BBA
MKKTIAFIFFFSFVGFSQNITLKSGDLLFQSMNCGPLCEAINEVTSGYQGHDFSHLGLVYIKNDSILVIEAAGSSVKITPYETFKTYTAEKMFVGRLKRKYRALIPEAIAFALQQIGVPYDEEYVYNNRKYYCSELLYDAFLHANKKPLFDLFPMTFKSPKTKEYFEVWVDYYKKLNIEIPEGKPGCNPGGISTSDKLKIIGTVN